MEINKDTYLSKFVVRESQTLFDLDFYIIHESVIQDRCPYCNNKLKTNLDKTIKRCVNKRVHAKSYVLTLKGIKSLTKHDKIPPVDNLLAI